MSVSHITDNFTWTEAMCHDGTEVPIELQPNARRLAEHVLEPIRNTFGGALIPVSWYRTHDYNKKVGGAQKSMHVYALAADIRPADLLDLPRLAATIEMMLTHGQLPLLGGFGKYRGWVHVDARVRHPANHIARWVGHGVGSEQ